MKILSAWRLNYEKKKGRREVVKESVGWAETEGEAADKRV